MAAVDRCVAAGAAESVACANGSAGIPECSAARSATAAAAKCESGLPVEGCSAANDPSTGRIYYWKFRPTAATSNDFADVNIHGSDTAYGAPDELHGCYYVMVINNPSRVTGSQPPVYQTEGTLYDTDGDVATTDAQPNPPNLVCAREVGTSTQGVTFIKPTTPAFSGKIPQR
jgi:hypothetical protein